MFMGRFAWSVIVAPASLAIKNPAATSVVRILLRKSINPSVIPLAT